MTHSQDHGNTKRTHVSFRTQIPNEGSSHFLVMRNKYDIDSQLLNDSVEILKVVIV